MYCLFLVGPPGSGKSTYAANYLSEDFSILSTDEYINKKAKELNTTYTEIFNESIGRATELLEAQIKKHNEFGMPYVIDQTNVSEETRKRKLKLVNPTFKKIAIYFPSYTKEVLQKRIENRVSAGGHFVAEEYIQPKIDAYRLPQKNEGFDLVISSSHFVDVMKVMQFR